MTNSTTNPTGSLRSKQSWLKQRRNSRQTELRSLNCEHRSVVLARTDSPATLLEQVADRVDTIEEPQQQRNISACVEILAGLKFDSDFIRRFLREELMRESVVYQEILQAGLQQGLQREKSLILRQLEHRLGLLAPELREQVQRLSIMQLEELGEALLDFSSPPDLVSWLQAHSQ